MQAFLKAKQLLLTEGEYQETTDRFHAMAEELREPYLSLLYKIGSDLDSIRFWITTLSYRNGYISKTFQNSVFLKLATQFAESVYNGNSESMLVVVDDPIWESINKNIVAKRPNIAIRVSNRSSLLGLGIPAVFKMLLHRAAFVIRDSYKLFRSRRTFHKPQFSNDPATMIYSWVTLGSIKLGASFEQAYFGEMVRQLKGLGHHIILAPMVLSKVDYGKAMNQLDEESGSIQVPHRATTFTDLIAATFASLLPPPRPKQFPKFADMDITDLLKADLRTHWISNYTADCFMVAAAVRRWAKAGLSARHIIYVYENQPWERAMCRQARLSFPGVQIVGYQHSGWPRALLNLYLADNGEPDAPLPDRVVTVGNYTSRLMLNGGYREEQIRVGGALQMESWRIKSTNSDYKPPMTPAQKTVLVSTCDSVQEASELAYMACHLYKPTDGVSVLLKFHPQLEYGTLEDLIFWPIPAHVKISEADIGTLLCESSLMVYSGSAVCDQAFSKEVPVIHLRPQFELDADSLESVKHLRLEATGLEELRRQVDWLLENREEYVSHHREAWLEHLDDTYGQVSDQSFRAFVEAT